MSKIILYGVAIVLVTASVVMGMDVYSTYQTLQEPAGSASLKVKARPDEPPARKVEKKDYNIIVSRNLFGAASLKPNSPSASRPQPKKIRPRASIRPKKSRPPLSIILVGTTVGPEGVRYAILEEAGSRTQTIHRMGDRVQGAVVQGVERGEVRLLRDGKVVTIRAFEQNLNAGSKQSASFQRPTAPDRRGRSTPSRSEENRSSQPRKLTRRLSRTSLENLVASSAGFENQLRVVDYRGNAGETGVRIFPSGRGRLIRMLGLRGGDVIHEIDDVPVTSRDDFQAGIINILGRNEATMKISRRGKRYDFILRIQ